MCNDYEDYYEPTLADEIFQEAKEKFENALKDEYKSKIERAEKVLAEQDVTKLELGRKKYELNRQERELERKFKDLENEFKKVKMNDFIKDLQKYLGQSYYSIDYRSETKEKCSSCDDNRKFEIKMPDGSFQKINCSCFKTISKYFIKETPIFSISVYKNNSNFSTYLRYVDWDERIEKIKYEDIHDDFSSVENKDNSYNIFYTNEKEAQKHADYLNDLNR